MVTNLNLKLDEQSFEELKYNQILSKSLHYCVYIDRITKFLNS